MPSSMAPRIDQTVHLRRMYQSARGRNRLQSMRRFHFHLSPRLFPSTQVRTRLSPTCALLQFTNHSYARYHSSPVNRSSIISFIILDPSGTRRGTAGLGRPESRGCESTSDIPKAATDLRRPQAAFTAHKCSKIVSFFSHYLNHVAKSLQQIQNCAQTDSASRNK
jgi:hypothetical protein